MKRILFYLVSFTFLLPSFSLFSQSNIQQATSINNDGAAPAASALLDVQATDKGVLIPRMTSAQRLAIPSPAAGLLVYEIPTPPIFVGGGFWYFNGTNWQQLSGSISPTSLIADTNGDTKVQTEESPNEDIIRFDLGGTEKMVLQKNANGTPRLELNDAAYTLALGLGAGSNNQPVFGVSGEKNTFVGYRSGNGNTTGSGNTAQGASTLDLNTSGAYNTAMGVNSLYANTTGNENTATGSFALTSNTTGTHNTAHGSNALLNNTTGDNNSAFGRNALAGNTDGVSNTAFGRNALFSNTSGYFNNANGNNALYSNTTGYLNTAAGNNALYSNSTGDSNTANGYAALMGNTTGIGNTATGREALWSNTTGTHNTASGITALWVNSTGSGNTAQGSFALIYNTTGSLNTAIGNNTLTANYYGSWNTCIGDHSNTSGNNILGATALGTSAIANADNKIVLGANVGGMVIGGYAPWSNLSDGRFKENIQDNVPGLAFINQLHPVTYTLDLDKLQHHITAQMPDTIAQHYYPTAKAIAEAKGHIQTGFIAQEVEIIAKQIGYPFDGVNVPKNPTDNYSIAYSQFVPSLVKAVQEQQTEIETGNLEMEKLKAENAMLKSQLEKITAALAGAGIAVEK